MTYEPDRERRALLSMAGCSEIPSCAGACADALKKASSGITRDADRDGILAGCFPDFGREHEQNGLTKNDWIERYVAAYADGILAANVFDGEGAKLLREVRSKLHLTALVIDRRGTRLDSDAQPLVPLGVDPASGADAAYKRSGPNDLYLVPVGDALKREVASGRLLSPLRLIVDDKTTYRVLLEALFTAGQNGLAEFEIRENSSAGRTLTLRAPPPAKAALNPADAPRLNLAAFIVEAGISLKAVAGNIAPGCDSVGAGITIPRVGGALDLAALSSCLRKLKAANPAFESEDSVTFSANPGTRVHEVMDIALTLQGPSRSLFPNVSFGVPR